MSEEVADGTQHSDKILRGFQNENLVGLAHLFY
jgi:hypothetical protein